MRRSGVRISHGPPFQICRRSCLEVTLRAITKIESGAMPDSRIETVRKIATALGVKVADLFK